MNIQVYPHRIILNKTNEVNSGEYNVNECTFEFSQEYEGLTKVAVFSLCDGTTKNVTILNNQCIIPVECLQETGQVQIGVYGYATENDNLVLRYSPTPQNFVVRLGSYKEGTQPVAPTPTDWEILVEQVSDIAGDVSSIQEDITGINGEISGINTDIRDLQDTKANINDLAEVAFTGEFSDLKNIPSYATTQQLNQEIQDRQDADTNLQSQIDAISVSSDVVDVVGTYQELLDYDTQHLKDNDIVKVLQDSTHNNALSYYRWDKETSTWSYVGSEGPFYTKSETNGLLNNKQNVIDINNMLSSDLVDDTNSTNKFVTQADINNWNNKEDKSNKVTEINSSSTDTQYPSAKCVYDSQEEQNEQIAELEMLYNAFPTVSDENEIIQLDNTAKVKFREIDLKGNTSQVVIPEEQGTSVSNTSIYVSDVNTDKEHTIEMSGNTYQETTTGKNLAIFEQPDTTISGLTITYDNATGKISIKGKATATTGVRVSKQVQTNIPSGTYTLSINSALPVLINYVVTDSQNNNTAFRLTAGSISVTNTLPNNGVQASLFVSIENNVDYDLEFYMQLESGSTATSFEKFTFGASPNPNYPQNIEVVTGTQNITIANSDNTQSTTYSVNLGNIELCKISTYQDRIYKQNDKWYLEKQIGKVILNGTQDLTSTATNTTGYYRFMVDIGKNIYATDTPTNVAPFYCNKLLGVTRGNTYSRIEGIAPSTTTYSYKSFNMYINAISQMTIEQANSWLSQNNIILYYPYATPTTTEITDTSLVNQLNALYNATIYPITNINTDTSNLLPYIDLHYNFVTPSPSPSRPSVVNVVKGNNTITISNSDNTESQVFPINLGDMELCKISTYQDYFYKDNGNWYKHSEIGKVMVNGSEDWNRTSIGGYSRFELDGVDYLKGAAATTTPNFISNYLIAKNFTEVANGSAGVSWWWNVSRKLLIIGLGDDRTLSDFKTWLNTHNTTVYYPLATTTNTQITDTTLITQLNNIKKAYSYDTQTNISQTNTDKPFIIYAEAIRSLKDVFE